MPATYADIPLVRHRHQRGDDADDDLGLACYELGRALVERTGITPERIMWDADEVLWDWLMSAPGVLVRLPWMLATRSLGHREYFVVRPGIFELLWGMHHAATEAGVDAHMRIWTNGYPWRLWAIAQAVPGFAELLGSSPQATHADFAAHPRIFYRTDFARAAALFTEPASRERALARLPAAARALVEAQLGSPRPLDSNLKLPELAALPADESDTPIKAGFGRVEFLVDDRGQNIERFVASGRRGVRVVSHSPWAFFGKVPNTGWRDPWRTLRGLGNRVSEVIGRSLMELAGEPPPASRNAACDHRLGGHVSRHEFTLDVPDAILRAEWIEPIRNLERQWRRPSRSPQPRSRA